MNSRRLLFVCYPDTNHPIGGVKQIYRQVELLYRVWLGRLRAPAATRLQAGLVQQRCPRSRSRNLQSEPTKR